MALEVAVCDGRRPPARATAAAGRVARGRIAVVEDGEVVGVVTRGDLLAALGRQEAPERRWPRPI